MKKENNMRQTRIEKITLNIGVGEPGEKLEKAYSLLEKIAGSKPVRIVSKKRIPSWGVRRGHQIGVKDTIGDSKRFDEL